MNWEAVGAIGEVLGALVVLATLAYLTLQVRQNSQLIRAATQGQSSQWTLAALTAVVSHEQAARVFAEGLTDPARLPEAEQVQFGTMMQLMMAGFSSTWQETRRGTLPVESWENNSAILRWYLTQPGVRRWWRHGRTRMAPAFVAFAEAELGAPREADPVD